MITKPAPTRDTVGWRTFTEQAGPWLPGVRSLLGYQRAWLRLDVVAGLTVVAVLIPSALAYGDLAGMPPVTGLYAALTSMLAYAIFGTSRQLMVGPESGSAILVASMLVTFGPTDPALYATYAAALALITGGILIAGGLAKLGFLADYVSKPVLVGYLNGVALIIILSQLGKIFGISLEQTEFFPKLFELILHLPETHWLTAILAGVLIVIYYAMKRFVPKIPAALVIVAGATLASWMLDFAARGISVVGAVQPGLPSFQFPVIPFQDVLGLMLAGFSLAILVFSDANIAARRAADRHDAKIDPDKEMIALGMGDIAAGLFQGFPVGSSQSRTVVNDNAGGQTQMAGVVAALVLAVILLFFTALLAPLPNVALAVVVIVSAVGLLDAKTVNDFFHMHWFYGVLSLVTTLGVLAIGLVAGILIAIVVSLVFVLARTARPHDAVLVDAGDGSKVSAEEIEGRITSFIPGIVVYRFDAQLYFANCGYFVERVTSILAQADPPPGAVLIDASGINAIDLTAIEALEKLNDRLKAQGIQLMFARLKAHARLALEQRGFLGRLGEENVFPTIHAGVEAFVARNRMPDAPAPEEIKTLIDDAESS